MRWGGTNIYKKPRISWGGANEERLKLFRKARVKVYPAGGC